MDAHGRYVASAATANGPFWAGRWVSHHSRARSSFHGLMPSTPRQVCETTRAPIAADPQDSWPGKSRITRSSAGGIGSCERFEGAMGSRDLRGA